MNSPLVEVEMKVRQRNELPARALNISPKIHTQPLSKGEWPTETRHLMKSLSSH